MYSSQCFDKTPEVTCAGQKFRRHSIHKCTQMYLFIKEPDSDTDDDDDKRLTHFKTRAAKGLARVINLQIVGKS